MQTLADADHPAKPALSLQDETECLEDLHRGLIQHVAAWRLAHDAAVDNATRLLARTDALIAALEAH